MGALPGLIAGLVGVAVGVAVAAGLSIAAETGVCAVAGGVVGLTVDSVTGNNRKNAAEEALLTLKHGQSAVVAEIGENWQDDKYDAMHPLGGVIYRRANTAAANAAFGGNYYDNCFYPSYCAPLYG